MKLDDLAAQAHMRLREREDQCDALERAISAGRTKRPLSELDMRRARLPVDLAIARALRLIAQRRADLPADLVTMIEGECA